MGCEEVQQRLHEADEEAKKLSLELDKEGEQNIESRFSFVMARVAEVAAVGVVCFLALWTSRRDLYTQV